MNVEKITATVKYSQDTGKGAWKSLELGCEASVSEREEWQIAQATLYSQLARQFRELWQRNGTAPEGHQIDVQPTQASTPPSAPPKEHWCPEHQQDFKRRNGQYGEFWSHQIKGTHQWCNEKGA